METVDNEVLQALSARKSVRVYTDEPVTEAERNAIFTSGVPSTHGGQPAAVHDLEHHRPGAESPPGRFVRSPAVYCQGTAGAGVF